MSYYSFVWPVYESIYNGIFGKLFLMFLKVFSYNILHGNLIRSVYMQISTHSWNGVILTNKPLVMAPVKSIYNTKTCDCNILLETPLEP